MRKTKPPQHCAHVAAFHAATVDLYCFRPASTALAYGHAKMRHYLKRAGEFLRKSEREFDRAGGLPELLKVVQS